MIQKKRRLDFLSTMIVRMFSGTLSQGEFPAIFRIKLNIERKNQRAVNQIYIFQRFTLVTSLNLYYHISLILRYNSSLEHRRTKWTKNEFLMDVLVKYIISKKTKISAQLPLDTQNNEINPNRSQKLKFSQLEIDSRKMILIMQGNSELRMKDISTLTKITFNIVLSNEMAAVYLIDLDCYYLNYSL